MIPRTGIVRHTDLHWAKVGVTTPHSSHFKDARSDAGSSAFS